MLTSSQVAVCEATSDNGYLQILPSITILLAILTTMALQCGLPEAMCLMNGKRMVPCYGSVEFVRFFPNPLRLSKTLISLVSCASGFWKECSLVFDSKHLQLSE